MHSGHSGQHFIHAIWLRARRQRLCKTKCKFNFGDMHEVGFQRKIRTHRQHAVVINTPSERAIDTNVALTIHAGSSDLPARDGRTMNFCKGGLNCIALSAVDRTLIIWQCSTTIFAVPEVMQKACRRLLFSISETIGVI